MSADQDETEHEPAGMPEQADAQHEPAGMPVQAADQPPDRDDDAGPVNPASDALAGAGASPLDNADSRDAAAPEDNVIKLPGGGSIKLPTPTDPTKDPQYIKLQKEEHELRQRAIDAAGRQVEEIEKSRRARTPPPRLQNVPQAPQQEFAGASHGFMLAAVALGALAGARGRSGATGALNAFSAALQGYHNGEIEVWKQKSQEWKQASDQAISSNQEKLQQYNAIWKDEKMDLDQKMEEYKIVASTYNDQISWNLADQKNFTLLGQTFQKDFNNTLNMAEKVARLDAINNSELRKQEAAKDQQAMIDQAAKDLAEDRLPPDMIPMRFRVPITTQASQKYGVNMADKELKWTAAKLDVKRLGSIQMGRLLDLENSLRPEFDQVIMLSRKMRLEHWPVANELELKKWIETDPNSEKGQLAARYLFATATIKDQLAQAAKGGYAPTEGAFQLAAEMFNKAWTTRQLEGVAEQLETGLKIRVNAIKNLDKLGPNAPNPYLPQGGTPAPAANDGWTVTPVQ